MMKIVIEHCEPFLSKWLLIEYEFASKIIGEENLIFSNVKNMKDAEVLSQYGEVWRESITRKEEIQEKILILDPKAEARLKPFDLKGISYVVVGGILGDHPPRGRTYLFISSKMPLSKKRNIGDWQFSIDGSVYIAWQVIHGKRLEEIPIVKGVEIVIQKEPFEHIIGLPYAYPLVNGRPLISEKLIEYLKSDVEISECA